MFKRIRILVFTTVGLAIIGGLCIFFAGLAMEANQTADALNNGKDIIKNSNIQFENVQFWGSVVTAAGLAILTIFGAIDGLFRLITGKKRNEHE